MEALEIVAKALSLSVRPMVFCSFGKDSLAMLHMVRTFKPDVDVVYLMDDCQFPQKHIHALRAIEKLGIKMPHTYPASFSDFLQKDDFFDIIHFYYIDGEEWYVLYNGCVSYSDGEEFSCAKELLTTPVVTQYSFPWDCIFHGQKNCEPIHIEDKIKIKEPIVSFGKGIMAMPLYNLEDEQVLEYTKIHSLPIQEERYLNNPSGGPTGTDQDLSNSDVIPTCYKCVDENNYYKEITCPKTKQIVPFVGKSKKTNFDFARKIIGKAEYLCSENT